MQTHSAVAANASPILAEYLTREELATELRVTVRTLARWHGLREGPRSLMMAGRRLYRRSDVAAWLEAQTEAAA